MKLLWCGEQAENLPDARAGGSTVRLVVAEDSLASMFRGAPGCAQQGGADGYDDHGAEAAHLSDTAAAAAAPATAAMPASSSTAPDGAEGEGCSARSARQRRRLRHLQRMGGAPSGLCVAILFVDDAAGADETSQSDPRSEDLRGGDDDDGGGEPDLESGVAHFHSTGSGRLLAEACRTAGTDYHCPALEAQLSTLWAYAKQGAASVERFDGTGLGWPLQTGDHWCTAHSNLQDCSLTLPPSALGLTDAEPAASGIAATMGSLLTRNKKAKNAAAQTGRSQNSPTQRQVASEDPDGALPPIWEEIVWNDDSNADGGGDGADGKRSPLIVAPHLVFQVLVRGSDLHVRLTSSFSLATHFLIQL